MSTQTPVFKWEQAATELVTHATKLNVGPNSFDSLETQAIKVLYKNCVFKF